MIDKTINEKDTNRCQLVETRSMNPTVKYFLSKHPVYILRHKASPHRYHPPKINLVNPRELSLHS